MAESAISPMLPKAVAEWHLWAAFGSHDDRVLSARSSLSATSHSWLLQADLCYLLQED